jgi:hypothetical protein
VTLFSKKNLPYFLFVGFVGAVVWVAITEKPKPVEADPCEKLTAEASPISTNLRVKPETSEKEYLECARKHSQTLVKVDHFVRETDGFTKEQIEKYGRKPIPEEELVRLSKMTQEERDREDCQKFNDHWERVFHKTFEQSHAGTDPSSIKFREATLAWCGKFK